MGAGIRTHWEGVTRVTRGSGRGPTEVVPKAEGIAFRLDSGISHVKVCSRSEVGGTPAYQKKRYGTLARHPAPGIQPQHPATPIQPIPRSTTRNLFQLRSAALFGLQDEPFFGLGLALRFFSVA